MQDLGSFGGGSAANSINDSGQIVGDSDYSDNQTRHAFMYTGSGPMQDINALLGNPGDSVATGINNNGQITGFATSGIYEHAFLYSGGSMRDLGTLGGAFSTPTHINDRGQVVGNADTTNGGRHAFLYNGSGSLQDLGTFGGSSSAACINNQGQIVGESFISGGVQHAFLIDGSGVMQDLNNLVDSGSGWTLTVASGINDQGQIVCSGQLGSTIHAFLLNPVPEPSTIALLLAGAACLFGFAWRRRRVK